MMHASSDNALSHTIKILKLHVWTVQPYLRLGLLLQLKIAQGLHHAIAVLSYYAHINKPGGHVKVTSRFVLFSIWPNSTPLFR